MTVDELIAALSELNETQRARPIVFNDREDGLSEIVGIGITNDTGEIILLPYGCSELPWLHQAKEIQPGEVPAAMIGN